MHMLNYKIHKMHHLLIKGRNGTRVCFALANEMKRTSISRRLYKFSKIASELKGARLISRRIK